MSAPKRREVGGSYLHHRPVVSRPEDHAELIAWEAAEDAARGAAINGGCTTTGCYDVVTLEYGPAYPCDRCRARDLAEIDLDGADDDREAGRVA